MDLVTIGIAVSRVEAAVVAGMLEGYGIPVYIGGYAQGTVEFNSLALGGYRLWVAEADWPVASDILRQSAAAAPDSLVTGPRRAIIRFLLAVLAVSGTTTIVAAALFGIPLIYAVVAPLTMVIIPVNPQGRADYYLTPPVEE